MSKYIIEAEREGNLGDENGADKRKKEIRGKRVDEGENNRKWWKGGELIKDERSRKFENTNNENN